MFFASTTVDGLYTVGLGTAVEEVDGVLCTADSEVPTVCVVERYLSHRGHRLVNMVVS